MRTRSRESDTLPGLPGASPTASRNLRVISGKSVLSTRSFSFDVPVDRSGESDNCVAARVNVRMSLALLWQSLGTSTHQKSTSPSIAASQARLGAGAAVRSQAPAKGQHGQVWLWRG